MLVTLMRGSNVRLVVSLIVASLVGLLILLRRRSPGDGRRGTKPPPGFSDLPSSKHGERWTARLGDEGDDERLKQPDGVVE